MNALQRIQQLESRIQKLEAQIRSIPRGGGASVVSSGGALGGVAISTLNLLSVKSGNAAIVVSGAFVSLLLKTVEGLEITADGLATKRKAAGGILVDANGLYLDRASYIPDSITVNAGTPTGDVTDIQSPFDGNVLLIAEVAATPGYDLEIAFADVEKFNALVILASYDGLLITNHVVSIDIYDYDASAWRQLCTVRNTNSYYDWHTFEGIENANYVDGSGNAKIRLYHYSAGIVGHNLYVDYAALIYK